MNFYNMSKAVYPLILKTIMKRALKKLTPKLCRHSTFWTHANIFDPLLFKMVTRIQKSLMQTYPWNDGHKLLGL